MWYFDEKKFFIDFRFLKLHVQNNANLALKIWEMVKNILRYVCAGFFFWLIKKS